MPTPTLNSIKINDTTFEIVEPQPDSVLSYSLDQLNNEEINLVNALKQNTDDINSKLVVIRARQAEGRRLGCKTVEEVRLEQVNLI